MTYSGDLGYEIWVAPSTSGHCSTCCGRPANRSGSALFGFRALMSMRMEKMFGTWFREYRPDLHAAGGRDGSVPRGSTTSSSAAPPSRPNGARDGSGRSSTSRSIPTPTSPPTSSATSRSGTSARTASVVGWVTSGAYAHHSGVSLALGYVPAELAVPGGRTPSSRSRSSATAAQPGCSPTPCSTRRRADADVAARARTRRRTGRGHRAAAELLDDVVAYLAEQRAGGRVVAADGRRDRRQRQRAGPPLRSEGADRRRPRSGGRTTSRPSCSSAGWPATRTSRRPTCCGAGGAGSTRRRPAWRISASASRRRRWRRRRAGLPGDVQGRADRLCGASTSSAAGERRACRPTGPSRGLAGEGDVHRPRRRPAGHRRTPAPWGRARARPRSAQPGARRVPGARSAPECRSPLAGGTPRRESPRTRVGRACRSVPAHREASGLRNTRPVGRGASAASRGREARRPARSPR